VKSLFRSTVGGAAGAISRITGTLGKGIAALTFDEEFQKKRREGIQRQPQDLSEGLARSGKGLVMVCEENTNDFRVKYLPLENNEGDFHFRGLWMESRV